ncbi:MAG: hydrogenase maturation protease [Acidobacteriia bacterium]|nr:hydrogenase maturation protease [Terriglobia bacterium]
MKKPSLTQRSGKPALGTKQWLVIGVGNMDRGDDGAGLVVARRMMRLSNNRHLVVESSGDAGDLIEMWKKEKRVILVDAMSSGSPPGSVRRFDLLHEVLPHSMLRSGSTHDFGIAHAIELSRALGKLPKQLILFGIEGECFDLGAGICQAVEGAVQKTITLIRTEIFESNSRKTSG